MRTLCVCGCCGSRAGGRAPDPQVSAAAIEVVELDVSVTRGGLRVEGLTTRDFALTDNGVAAGRCRA